MAFDLGNLLQRYLNPAASPSDDAANHFDEVSRHASPEVMGAGIADALRYDDKTPLGDMVSSIFSRANPQQQDWMLNQIN